MKKLDVYSSLVFTIKNGGVAKNKNNPVDVTYGEVRIPLNLLYTSEFKINNCVEVNLTSKLKMTQVVGVIKSVVSFSNTEFDGLTETAKKLYHRRNQIVRDIRDTDFIVINCNFTNREQISYPIRYFGIMILFFIMSTHLISI